jgi:uncharacterized membrane protein YphA (DoxX/SURF4 family)
MAIGPKTRSATLWAFKILVGLVFAAAAAAKIAGAPMMVQEFGVIGLGQWFRYFTGAVEIGSVVLLLIPSVSRFGALGLVGVCIGALFVQATILHGDLIHVFVLLAATGFLAWNGFARPNTGLTPTARAA